MTAPLPLFADLQAPRPPFQIAPVQKLGAIVGGLFIAAGDGFETTKTETLHFDFEGIAGDAHAGFARRAGAREPWYARGTEMRNERQISIVATDELAIVAARMGLPDIRPEWIGANLALDGVACLSMLPAGTLLFFKGGATLKIDGQNAPCRHAGKLVAERAGMADIVAGALSFAQNAKRLRGLVGWVEKPGVAARGEAVSVRVPEQWIYRAPA